MTDNVYAAPQSSLASADAQSGESRFFVVSPGKLAVMYLGTLGLYFLYWFYKQWERYKESQPFDSPAGKIWPVMRTIFSPLFVHALFKKVKEAEPGHPATASWPAMADATLLVALLLVYSFSDKLLRSVLPLPTIYLLEVAMMIPTTLLLRRVQHRINAVCGDPAGAANARLTAANVVWLVLGAFFWLGFAFVVLALFVNPNAASGEF